MNGQRLGISLDSSDFSKRENFDNLEDINVFYKSLNSATMIENFSTFWVDQMSNNVEVIFAEPPSTTSTAVPEFDIYNGCNDIKTCFGIGENDCVRSRRCLTVGAVTYEEGKFVFEMRASGETIA